MKTILPLKEISIGDLPACDEQTESTVESKPATSRLPDKARSIPDPTIPMGENPAKKAWLEPYLEHLGPVSDLTHITGSGGGGSTMHTIT